MDCPNPHCVNGYIGQSGVGCATCQRPSGVSSESEAEIAAFREHLTYHRTDSAPDCRFCDERDAKRPTPEPSHPLTAAFLAATRAHADYLHGLCETARAVLRDFDNNEFPADCIDNMNRLRRALRLVEGETG